MSPNRSCSYDLVMSVRAFCELSVAEGTAFMLHLVAALVICDRAYLEHHPGTPTVYRSGVYYRPDGAVETQWIDIPAALERGWADCKALSAWRVAELQTHGEPTASAIVDYYPDTGFHTLVRRADGSTEDPSARLGMVA